MSVVSRLSSPHRFRKWFAARLQPRRQPVITLAEALIAQDVMSFLPTIAILTAAASLEAGWLSYIQGTLAGQHAHGERLAGAITFF